MVFLKPVKVYDADLEQTRKKMKKLGLSEDCAQTHEFGEDVFLPVVNSPRTGVCAYAG
jgi:hypothetical protein